MFLPILLSVFFSGSLFANSPVKTEGISGADIRTICAANGTLYAGSSTGNFYYSKNQGSTWIKTKMPYPSSFTNNFVKLFASGNRIFASTNNGLYFTDNEGTSWTTTSITNPTVVTGMAQLGSTLFFATNNQGLYTSSNLGASFTHQTDALIPNDITCIYIDSSGIIYLGAYTFSNYHYLRSSDQGQSWQAFSVPEIPTGILVNNNRVFVSSYYQNYYSDDNWNTRDTIDLIGAYPNGRTYKIYQTNSSIFLYYNYGALRSRDSGNTWNPVGFNKSMNEITKLNNQLFIASKAGIYKSSDDGLNWLKSDFGIEEITIGDFIQSKDTLLCSTKNLGLFQSIDHGVNWSYTSYEIPYENINQMIIDDKGTHFALVDGNLIYTSIDNGSSWKFFKKLSGLSREASSFTYFNHGFYMNDLNRHAYRLDSNFEVIEQLTNPSSVEYFFSVDTILYACTSTSLLGFDGNKWDLKLDGAFDIYMDFYLATELYGVHEWAFALNHAGKIYTLNNIRNSLYSATIPAQQSIGCVLSEGVICAGLSNNLESWGTLAGIWNPDQPLVYTLNNPNQLPKVSNNPQVKVCPTFIYHPEKNTISEQLFYTKTVEGLWYFTNSLGTTELDQSRLFTVSPNPFTTEINIQSKLQQSIGKMEIFNLQGKQIWTHTASDESSYSIHEFSSLQSGIYFLKIEDQVYKLVK